ncbi:MAG TPA: nodulation protein NfeD [Bryobacteraceae bacterium]|nr:nodulation protein NfeD [Bryobacteraceae bacterium]
MAKAAAVFLLLTCATLCAAPRVIAVDVGGVVHPVTVEIVGNALEQARREGADLVLIRLNTPGGLMEAMRQTVERIVASPVPVATFVTPSGGRAASAGFFILLSGDVAAMSPATSTGAASPVLLAGEMDAVMRKKVENDAAAMLRGIAGKRGRNSALAEQAVLESKSFSDKEALDNRLIEIVARDESDLFRQLEGREVVRFDGSKTVLRVAGATVADYELTWREKLVSTVSDPNIALILLVLGALGIYIEFSSPGLIAPGVAGGIMVLLGLSALSVLPINWIGVALLLLAVALFILEANFASHGVLATGGAVAMVLGAVLLIDSPIPEMRIRVVTAVAITLPFAIVTVFLLSLVARARKHKVMTGPAGLVNQAAVAHSVLNPAGKVFVHGEFWDAVSSHPVEPGARVKITSVEGLVLKVEPE